jgi:hypothetical protein
MLPLTVSLVVSLRLWSMRLRLVLWLRRSLLLLAWVGLLMLRLTANRFGSIWPVSITPGYRSFSNAALWSLIASPAKCVLL